MGAFANPSPAPPISSSAPLAIDATDIIVTARLRRERLEDVPVTIAVLGGREALRRGIATVEDLAATVPNLDFRTAVSSKDRTIYIRGIGTASTSAGVEPSVSTVLDGVLLLRPGQQTLEVADIERIEILKGPQGTLFGKNASAGVVNIMTVDPIPDWTGTALLELTSDDGQRLKGGVGGPLGADAAFRLSGLLARFGGNVRNRTSGEMVNGYRRAGLRGKVSVEPVAGLRLLAAGDFAHERNDTPYAVFASRDRVAFGSNLVTTSPALDAALLAEGITPSARNRETFADGGRAIDRNYGASLQGDLALGLAKLTSITAWRGWTNTQDIDLDGFTGPYPGIVDIHDRGTLRSHQLSQELRLASSPASVLEYVVGAYLLHSRTAEQYLRTISQVMGPRDVVTGQGIGDWAVRMRHYSLFGEATLRLTRRLRGIAGGRLIRDDLRYRHQRSVPGTAPLPGVFPPHRSTGRTARTGYSARASLQYDVTDRITGYATFTRGYKGPAFNVFFNMRDFDEQPLRPETSNSYEAGLKGVALGGRVRFGLAAYLAHYSGFQASFADVYLRTPIVRLVNAGKVSTRGVEAEVALDLPRRLEASISVARGRAKIDHFACPPGAPICSPFSVDGQPLPYSQKWKVFASASKTWALNDRLSSQVQVDCTYTSRTQYQLDQRPDTVQPGYAIINASLALLARNGFEARVFGRNLLNANYSSFLLPNSSGGGLLRYVPRDAPRYFGFMLIARR